MAVRTLSGVSETDSMPFSTKKAAKSGLSDGAWPQRPTGRPSVAMSTLDGQTDSCLYGWIVFIEEINKLT